MSSKLKTYQGHVQFKAVGITVRACNLKEAKAKMKRRVTSLKTMTRIDHQNFFVDQV